MNLLNGFPVFVMTASISVMILLNIFFSLYHAYLRKHKECRQRLLNVLYFVLAISLQVIASMFLMMIFSTLIHSLSKVGSFINVVNIYCGLVDTSSEASMARYVISYVRIFQSNFCLLCAILIGEKNIKVEETELNLIRILLYLARCCPLCQPFQHEPVSPTQLLHKCSHDLHQSLCHHFSD